MIIVNLSQSMSQFGVMDTAKPCNQGISKHVITL